MSKTILFVEDDADDRDFLLDAVKEVNPSVNVVFAKHCLEALNYLNDEKEEIDFPSLIVLDLNMPVLDGKETYRKIRNELKLDAVPIIVFTSSQNPHDKAMFNNLGVEVITKPYDFSYMHTIVTHMLSVCENEI